MSRVVRFHRIGGPEVLQIDEIEVAAPKAGEVQIQVEAIGVNRAEVMYRKGEYISQPDFPAVLGYEAAGRIVAMGEGVSGFALGDAVSVVPAFSFAEYGMYGERVNAPVHAVVKHPANLSFEEAAATWMMFVTAYGALIDMAKLQAGDAVLIRAASSSVGLAAIQIANMVGATPIALTRSNAKRQALIDAGARHVIATEEQDLVAEVTRITEGKGARVVFDPVGGAQTANIFRAMAFEGLFFQYGALDTGDLHVPVMDLLGKHLSLRGYELFEITGNPTRLEQAKRFVLDGLASGKLRPLIAKTFAFDQIAQAHRFMESNAQVGKIVVRV